MVAAGAIHCAAMSQTLISAAQCAARIEVVANCRRRNPGPTHRMADLVETEHHVTRGTRVPQWWCAGAHQSR